LQVVLEGQGDALDGLVLLLDRDLEGELEGLPLVGDQVAVCPQLVVPGLGEELLRPGGVEGDGLDVQVVGPASGGEGARDEGAPPRVERSEEHTSELQSRVDLVCRLLLEKKKR